MNALAMAKQNWALVLLCGLCWGAFVGELITHRSPCYKSAVAACAEGPRPVMYGTKILSDAEGKPIWDWVSKDKDANPFYCGSIIGNTAWMKPPQTPTEYKVYVVAEPYKSATRSYEPPWRFKTLQEAQAHVEHWCKP